MVGAFQMSTIFIPAGGSMKPNNSHNKKKTLDSVDGQMIELLQTGFVVKCLDELNELIFEKINEIDGIARTETSLFLNYIKRQYDWGTALG